MRSAESLNPNPGKMSRSRVPRRSLAGRTTVVCLRVFSVNRKEDIKLHVKGDSNPRGGRQVYYNNLDDIMGSD